MTDNFTEECIRDIDIRLRQLDFLLRKDPGSVSTYPNNLPARHGEKQFWTDRREEKQQLLAERERLSKN
jgi:hypothetical protein